ncbi:MAG: peptidoglycan DD-metalloendopeptidase family protein [Fusobacteriota bacterium]
MKSRTRINKTRVVLVLIAIFIFVMGVSSIMSNSNEDTKTNQDEYSIKILEKEVIENTEGTEKDESTEDLSETENTGNTEVMPTEEELLNEDEYGVSILKDSDYIFEKEYTLDYEETSKEEDDELKIEYYIVKKGDTLYEIAKKLGKDIDILIANNPEVRDGVLQIGQKLALLSKEGINYEIKKGDTFSELSNRYKVKIADILEENDLNTTNLVVGQKIFIPNPDIHYIKSKNQNVYVRSQRNSGFSWPIKWRGVTSPFGQRFHPVLKKYYMHDGVDLRASTGTNIYAPRSGRVTYAGWSGGYGNLLKLSHSNGYSTRYGHLVNIFVNSGEYVKKGQLVAETGNTGRSTGPHLHYEIRKNGKPLDPMRFR